MALAASYIRTESEGGLPTEDEQMATIVAYAADNGHDLVAHMAGIDYCVALVEFDPQLALVEFAVPLAMMIGSVLAFTGILFFLIQVRKLETCRATS